MASKKTISTLRDKSVDDGQTKAESGAALWW